VTAQFALVYSKVAAAASYVVQRDTSATFATSRDTAIAASDTSVQVSIPKIGQYKVRVLAVDPYGTRGQASATQTITFYVPTLAFTQQPTNAEGNVAVSPAVTVTVLDALGTPLTTATNSISITFGTNPWAAGGGVGGHLSGTTTAAAVSGV